jgi:hypothetical protein
MDELNVVEVAMDSLKIDTAKIVSIYYKQSISGQDGIPTYYSIITKK